MPIDRNSAQYITGAIYKPTQTSAPGVWDLDDQANNIAKNLWPLPPQAVQRSLRFNSQDNIYLQRTVSVAGNRRLWTWSCWVKLGSYVLSGTDYRVLFEGYTGSLDTYHSIAFNGQQIAVQSDFNNSGGGGAAKTTPIYRDPSAWYHITVAYDNAQSVVADRCKIYVNGSLQTLAVATISQNFDNLINSTNAHRIGNRWVLGTSNAFDGYMADINFVDGQALTPSSFGETDPQTGVWIPKRYLGTYGTNGFRLSFANNSSTTALGYDSSGQGNNWTANNFSVTPGVNNDVFVDVPSLYGTDTRLGGEVLGNYCTLNPLSIRRNFTLSNGNLDGINNGSNDGGSTGTLAVPTTGKWYWEMILTGINGGIYLCYTGLVSQPNFPGGSFVNVPGCLLYPRSGNVCFYDNAGNAVCITETAYNGDVYGLAYDADTGLVDFYKNGLKYSGYSVTVTTGINYWPAFFIGNQGPTASINFGQRPFAYPAPTGYKALCTTNLPAPAIGQTSSNRAGNYFNVVTYTGDGAATKSITGVGFQPDLVWIKSRTNASGYHILVDSVRGAGLWMATNATTGDSTAGQLVSSLDANGFSLNLSPNNTVNELNANYVAWCWNAGGTSVTNGAGTNGATIASTYRANRAAGFSIVTYTGTGTAATVAHGLGVKPLLIIGKGRNVTGAYNWMVYHQGQTATKHAYLNLTNVFEDPAGGVVSLWNDTEPTANVFSISSNINLNASGGTYVAYCWAPIPGFSDFGSWQNNNSTDGTFVYTGFKPVMILLKNTDNTENWYIIDSKRPGYNVSAGSVLGLCPNLTGSEPAGFTSTATVDILSNGFKIRSTNPANGEISFGTRNYVYAAFAETPARLSTAR